VGPDTSTLFAQCHASKWQIDLAAAAAVSAAAPVAEQAKAAAPGLLGLKEAAKGYKQLQRHQHHWALQGDGGAHKPL
jgi:hypothetical protein